ncbi:hypothetical protein HD554DRAFT_2330155 [Boletus coccyginus]|nr:hypothetical protein HD554DRAFT_2330155 [Boletus coccyginus]
MISITTHSAVLSSQDAPLNKLLLSFVGLCIGGAYGYYKVYKLRNRHGALSTGHNLGCRGSLALAHSHKQGSRAAIAIDVYQVGLLNKSRWVRTQICLDGERYRRAHILGSHMFTTNITTFLTRFNRILRDVAAHQDLVANFSSILPKKFMYGQLSEI